MEQGKVQTCKLSKGSKMTSENSFELERIILARFYILILACDTFKMTFIIK